MSCSHCSEYVDEESAWTIRRERRVSGQRGEWVIQPPDFAVFCSERCVRAWLWHHDQCDYDADMRGVRGNDS